MDTSADGIKLLTAKVQLMTQIISSHNTVKYGVTCKAQELSKQLRIGKSEKEIDGKVFVTIPKENYELILDLVLLLSTDHWDRFKSYIDSEIWKAEERKELLRILG